MIDAKFKFHPIGQGCFYSGKIIYKHTPFNFVYDCGTDSRRIHLNKEITDYKANLENNVLDLLIISHFDADHVNGVFELLRGIRCKTLLIPYYNPIERLLLAATSVGQGREYLEFLKNPINFFTDNDYNIDQIIIVNGPDDSDEPGEPVRPINPENLNIESLGNLESLKLEADLLEGSEAKDIFTKIEDEDGEPIKNPQKVKILNRPHRVSLIFWEFFFYLKKHKDEILINKVTKDIDDLLHKERVTLRDLFDEDYIGELIKIYRVYFKQDFNSTSLVTYHGSALNRVGELYFFDKSRYAAHYFSLYHEKFGTLLTGDINIKTNRQNQRLVNYYHNYIPRICFFQVPHHGAAANWNIKVPNGLNSFEYYIVNHGVGRIHHPSVDVVEYIKENCPDGVIRLNNEVQGFEYRFRFY